MAAGVWLLYDAINFKLVRAKLPSMRVRVQMKIFISRADAPRLFGGFS